MDITSPMQEHDEKEALEERKKAKGGEEVRDIVMKSLTGNIFFIPTITEKYVC